MDEFYPMPMFINLEVKDLPASVAWYQDALGFRLLFSDPPGEPAMAHLRRDRYQDLLLCMSFNTEPRALVVTDWSFTDSYCHETAVDRIRS